MEIFGDLERILSEDLYPYRWPLSGAALVVLALASWGAWRVGWIPRLIGWARTRPLVAGLLGALILAVVVPTFWVLASPLWTRTTLVEESPLAVASATEPTATATEAAAGGGQPGGQAGGATPAAPAASGTSGTSGGATPADTPASGGADAATTDGPRAVLTGAWQGADDFHFAEGVALLIETEPGVFTLRVEEFSVRNGPDLFVYLSPDPAGGIAGAVKLGPLKATDGAFNYEVPSGVTVEQMRSAVVWCDAFAVLFGHAPLE